MLTVSYFTAVAGVAFGIALLWVMTQWLKADQAAASAEQDVRRGIEKLQQQAMMSQSVGSSAAHGALPPVDRYGDPFPAAEASDQADEQEAAKDRPLADDETALSRLLFGWGATGMVFGLIAGASSAGAVGATIGAVLGSTLAIATVVIGVIVLDRIGAKKHESE
jgi:hypothetical protein